MQTAQTTQAPDMFAPTEAAAMAVRTPEVITIGQAPPAPKPAQEPYTSSEQIGDLIGALAEAQLAFHAIERDQTADVVSKRTDTRYTYSYASLAAVLNAVRPALAGQGVALMQFPQNGTQTVAVTTLLAHRGGQFIKSELRLSFVATDPQALGSAITYLRRYAVQSILGVAPVEDDDGKSAGGGASFATQETVRASSPARVVTMPERQSTQSGAPSAAAAPVAVVTLSRMQPKQLPARPGMPACPVWVYELTNGRQFATKDALIVDKLEAWRKLAEPIGALDVYEGKGGWTWLNSIASAKSGEQLTPARS